MAQPDRPFTAPGPEFTPGDASDLGELRLPAPDALPRPPVDAPARDLDEHAYGLLRVLDDDGQARGAWAPDLDLDTLKAGLETMVLTRAYDARMMKMQRTKRLSFYMKCLGEEAVATAAAMALRGDDMLFPSYRQQAALIARGADLTEMMCQCISNAADPLLGRQLPVHYADASRNWFSISGNLGTQFPQAVGWAMASALRGQDALACSWIGEGTTAEGDFHAALTLASSFNAPTVLNVVNNQWAISMHQSISRGQADSFAAKAIGYGLPGLRVDGNDFLAVHAATSWAAARARAGMGTTLIELFTYRGEAHSTSDDPSRYRPRDAWQAWPLGDPVERLSRHLTMRGGWQASDQADLEADCKRRVDRAWKQALTHGTLQDGPHAPAGTLFEDVFAEQPWHLTRQKAELGA